MGLSQKSSNIMIEAQVQKERQLKIEQEEWMEKKLQKAHHARQIAAKRYQEEKDQKQKEVDEE